VSQGIDKIKARLAHKQSLVSGFMQSEAGKEIIRILEEEFYDGELLGGDSHETYYNLGRRDVVAYLRQLANWRTEGKQL